MQISEPLTAIAMGARCFGGGTCCGWCWRGGDQLSLDSDKSASSCIDIIASSCKLCSGGGGGGFGAGIRAKEDRTGTSRGSLSLWKAFKEKISLRLNMTQKSTFTERSQKGSEELGLIRA